MRQQSVRGQQSTAGIGWERRICEEFRRAYGFNTTSLTPEMEEDRMDGERIRLVKRSWGGKKTVDDVPQFLSGIEL